MKKEIISVIILITLLFSILSGCFDNSKNNSGPTPSTNTYLPTFINTTINGYINNTDGENLEGVTVRAYNKTNQWQNSTYTNKIGYYRLNVFGGYFTITIEHEDYEQQKKTYNLQENEIIWINITLTSIAEDFVFTLLDSSEKHLSDYRGKVIILDLWATWCVPCQFQMTELKKIYENYSRNDLEIISVDIDPRESVQLIQSFLVLFKEQIGIELDWIFGLDDGSISEKYMKEGAIPTLCIFDQNGRLRFRKAGVCVYSEIPQGLSEDTPLLAPIINELID